MAYDETLAHRVREYFAAFADVEEKRMFGGLCLMLNGKMCVGVNQDDIMCRIDPEVYEAALERKGAREMDFTGRPMKGYVFVDAAVLQSQKELGYWLDLCIAYNSKAKASKKKK